MYVFYLEHRKVLFLILYILISYESSNRHLLYNETYLIEADR